MAHRTLTRSSVVLALGTLFLWGCASEPRAADTPQTAAQQPAAHSEQALLEDLAVANRILAREAAILDVQGHVTARSLVNSNHYYIARYLSPGGVTAADFIENDLDSTPVHGPRNDQAREIYLHGEIFKARPDVMAVVHAHTPEFVAFGMSSVPLWNGESMAPVWDIRQFNKGRSGIVSTPALGQAMAAALGRSEGLLLWGHGIAMTGGSVKDVVSRVIELRDSARLQQATISMGGAWKPQVRKDDPADRNRTWEHLERAVLQDTGGRVPTSPQPDPAKPSDPVEATTRDLVLANRILASEELGILDTLGHVSVRNPDASSAYFVAPGVAAGTVTARDVVQRTASGDANGQGLSIHDEVYKARPDVMAVLYARTPEIVAFTAGLIKLRPVVNGGAFIADGLPVFNMSGLDPGQPLLASPALGRGVAEALGKKAGVLLSGHGFVLTAASIYNLVDRAYALRLNARIQQQALALRGTVAYLNERPVPPAPANAAGQNAPLGPPEGRAWVYWSQNVSLD
ncbi:MAG: class II aldolase/adducin family protein [Vicinamibacterales bacterium]